MTQWLFSESGLMVLGEVVLETGMTRLQNQCPLRGPHGSFEIAAVEIHRPEVAPVPRVSGFGGHRPEQMIAGGVEIAGPERGDSGQIVETRDGNHGVDLDGFRIVFEGADRLVLDCEVPQSAMTPG